VTCCPPVCMLSVNDAAEALSSKDMFSVLPVFTSIQPLKSKTPADREAKDISFLPMKSMNMSANYRRPLSYVNPTTQLYQDLLKKASKILCLFFGPR
jgi:hypothetical protein